MDGLNGICFRQARALYQPWANGTSSMHEHMYVHCINPYRLGRVNRTSVFISFVILGNLLAAIVQLEVTWVADKQDNLSSRSSDLDLAALQAQAQRSGLTYNQAKVYIAKTTGGHGTNIYSDTNVEEVKRQNSESEANNKNNNNNL
ncbi:hypothetical protein P5G51_016785 [Virgibacillus sp. 179-BFC.A HS]|uniref:Uncharacterized protein n=1 Tax=Tigheibacillus jepli TaxID=3035914 RepID=A0ABU5CKF7_9BACI|nr:hypothetical protein [Virgibacillus sp. 179-BFC.A HS]MDY0406794.1 hypothetical protein [Virgibacillus sp. 179-BFC.A HS]